MSGHDVSFDPDPEDDEDFAPATYLPSPQQRSGARRSSATTPTPTTTTAWPPRSASSTSAAAMILSRRWLADNKATLHELAAEYGVSAERIRQIEANAIAKLKKQLAAA